MSFLFNFDADESECAEGKKENQDNNLNTKGENKSTVQVTPAAEVTQFYPELTSKFETLTIEVVGDTVLEVVDTSKVEKQILEDEAFKPFTESSNIVQALSSNSDLVAGVYEGGLKIWECGIDMVNYLSSHSLDQTIDIKGKRVFELGCGAGLPGVYCCKQGAQVVDFQDYNKEVLQLLTHFNATSNSNDEVVTKSRYFSGDWSSLVNIVQKENLKYDIILSAETIYNPDNYASLHSVFDAALSEDGMIIVSAKVYYFGVGGSVEAFTEYLNSQRCFKIESEHDIEAGVPRKILVLRRHTQNSR